jgi:predicted transcriptional regulator
MGRKRTSLEIYIDIMRAVDSGACKPTKIMYKCNLAWKPFKNSLISLVEHGVIRAIKKGKRKTYELTEKGHRVFRNFERAEAMLVSLRTREKVDNIL